MKAIIPLAYPRKPPKMIFMTSVFHPNVDPDSMEVVIYNDNWKASFGIKGVFMAVVDLLKIPNFENFVNKEATDLYRLSKDKFDQKAKKIIYLYA